MSERISIKLYYHSNVSDQFIGVVYKITRGEVYSSLDFIRHVTYKQFLGNINFRISLSYSATVKLEEELVIFSYTKFLNFIISYAELLFLILFTHPTRPFEKNGKM